MAISVFPAKSDSALPQLQRRITTTGYLDLGTIRNCYFILTGGGGGGAGGTNTAPAGGGAAGAIGGSLAFQQVHLTIGAGGNGGAAGAAGSAGGHSYMSRLQERAYNIQNAIDATYVSCAGGAGGNPSGTGVNGTAPDPGAPTISGVGSYNFFAGSPSGGSNGGATTTTPNLGSGYGMAWPRQHFISSWISNHTQWWADPTTATNAGTLTYQPGFAGLFNTMHTTTNNYAWDGTTLRQPTVWMSSSGGGASILPYSGGAAGGAAQVGGSGGDGLLAGGGGGGGTGTTQAGGVGGSNIFFHGQPRSTGAANGAGGGSGGAGAASAGTVGNNGASGVGGAGGAGGLGGGGGGAGGFGSTSGAGAKGGDGVFLLFY